MRHAAVGDACRQIREKLNSCGLQCGEPDGGDHGQVFPGLDVDITRGKVVVQKGPMGIMRANAEARWGHRLVCALAEGC